MKRTLVVAGVVLFALWPAVHRGLVAVFDVNPWKLAGWAMYVRPHFASELVLSRLRGSEELPVGVLTPWEQTLADEFVERRYSLGRLASPESLAQELLRRHAAVDEIVVEIRTPFFELASARVEQRVERRVIRR